MDKIHEKKESIGGAKKWEKIPPQPFYSFVLMLKAEKKENSSEKWEFVFPKKKYIGNYIVICFDIYDRRITSGKRGCGLIS